MKKQAKQYPSPEDETYREGVFEFAKQWCDNDTNHKRGAMVMLTDDGGTHYMFIGNKSINLKGAYDLMTAKNMKSAGRTIQLTFQHASLYCEIDRETKAAGIDITKAKSTMERMEMLQKIPRYDEIWQQIGLINEEIEAIWREK